MVAKREITCFEQFLLLAQCFQKPSAAEASESVCLCERVKHGGVLASQLMNFVTFCLLNVNDISFIRSCLYCDIYYISVCRPMMMFYLAHICALYTFIVQIVNRVCLFFHFRALPFELITQLFVVLLQTTLENILENEIA